MLQGAIPAVFQGATPAVLQGAIPAALSQRKLQIIGQRSGAKPPGLSFYGLG